MRRIATSRRGRIRPLDEQMVPIALLALAAIGLGSAAPRVATAESGSTIRIDATAASRAQLVLLTLEPSRHVPDAQGYGRVLDPMPIVAAVAGHSAARALDEAAAAELARTGTLARDEQNASDRELQAARAAAARARADRAMAYEHLVAAIGSRLAHDPDLASLARRLADREVSLIRVDVPGSEPIPAPERGATLTSFPASIGAIEAEYVGPAPAVDPTLPGWGLLFLVRSNAPAPGTWIEARVSSAVPPAQGVTIPSTAACAYAGGQVVFVDRGEGVFERRAIESIPLEDGSRFVPKNLHPGERIVVEGAQQLLSAGILGQQAGESE